MKTFITTSIALMIYIHSFAQTAVYDSVYMGAGYARQVYYSLSNDSIGEASMLTVPSWDFGFAADLMDGSIIVNHVKGIVVYVSPDTAWAELDTAGINGWTKLYNTDTSWLKGAFNTTAVPGNPFDFGWGVYDFDAHSVVGVNKLYVIKTSAGFKKLRLISKTGSTNTYTFRIANLDDSMDNTVTVNGNDFSGKNFGYYNIANNEVIDIEPAKTTWDILFTRYISIPLQPGAPPVAGVFSNKGVKVARASQVDVATVNYDDYVDSLSEKLSAIGYNWKVFDYMNNKYDIDDSLCYFIKTAGNGAVYKLRFTGFGGGTTGMFAFGKEEIQLSGVTGGIDGSEIKAAAYPNPSDGQFSIIFSTEKSSDAIINVFDLTGRNVWNEKVMVKDGLNVIPVSINKLAAGSYFVKVTQGTSVVNLKTIVAK